MSSTGQIKIPTSDNKKKKTWSGSRLEPNVSIGKIVSAVQAYRRPPSRTSSTLRSLLFFPWNSSCKGLEITVPHPHDEPVQGLISPEKHSFSWQPTTLVGEAAVVTPAWQSMLHTESLTCTRFHPLSFAPFVSLTLCLPLCSSLSQPPREGNEEMESEQKKKEKRKKWRVTSESPLLSVSLFSLCCPPSSRLLAPVSGMSWRWRWGVPAPGAKPIDPLITCCSTSFREEQVCTCTLNIL